MSAPEETKPLDPDDSPEAQLEKKERKRLKKVQKALEEARRPLNPWERYRALIDAAEMEQDLVDLADHKARFALLIMGTFTAVNFIVGTRSEAVALVPLHLRGFLTLYLGVYALLALYFFIQAIESLRPREAKPNVRYPGEAGLEDYPMGLRFFADVLTRDVSAYRSAWRSIHLGQLNAEVAIQVHALARINKAKYGALAKLYRGLKAMTLLTAALISGMATLAYREPSEGGRPPAAPPGVVGKREPGAILGEAERFAAGAALEPSGVAFHAPSGHLFVVGDEGTLAEMSTNGAPLWSQAGLSNLEDVAVHSPTGLLMLLSEKRGQLILFDPAAKRELRRFKLDKRALLGKEPGDPNQGFEGLAFRADEKQRGGGVFYLTHQRSPSVVVAIAFDLQKHEKTIDGDAVVGRFRIEGFRDLTAVTYAPTLQRLLVVADHKDRILVLKLDGTLEDEIVLPGLRQEGIALDDAGNLWIADDRGGLLRFPSALAALHTHLATRATEAQR